MRRIAVCTAFGLALGLVAMLPSTADAQQDLSSEISKVMFTPWTVMEHQEEIWLSDEQKQKLAEMIEVSKASAKQLWMELEEERAALSVSLADGWVDEATTVAAAESIFAKEIKAKMLNFKLMVKVKNLLEPEQEAKLTELNTKVKVAESGS